MFLKIAEGVSCSICGAKPENFYKDFSIFECPECSVNFCQLCFEIDKNGDGHTVLCPKCGGIVELPKATIKSP